jgi:uncharacterized damage-inducible protein DinB
MEDAMDTLRDLFRYHTWATLRLIDHCTGLPAEALRESAPGTYGPVLDTLVHLVAAEQRYLRRLPGEQPGMTMREGMSRRSPTCGRSARSRRSSGQRYWAVGRS